LIEDNYNGVTLWENADRFCGSAANTSTGYCTLVNPLVAKVSTCTAANIAKEPYYSDCRWKTQNVKVHHNTFKINRANVSKCPASMCVECRRSRRRTASRRVSYTRTHALDLLGAAP
jgi:hypothetical protein